MTPLEIIALILVLIGIIKLIVILRNPISWYHFVRDIYSNPTVTGIVAFILGAIILYYLLQEVNIIQIFAVLAFFSMFMLMGWAAYSKEFLPLAKKVLTQKNILLRSWPTTLIWVLLTVWVLWAIYGK